MLNFRIGRRKGSDDVRSVDMNGRIVDGSGMPSFRGDIGVKNGKIAEIGKLSGPAERGRSTPTGRVARRALSTITAITTRRSPGTRCAPSPATTAPPSVIFGNCSRSLAPVRKGSERPAVGIPLLCRGYPDGGARHLGVHRGDLPRTSSTRWTTISASMSAI